MQVGQSVPKGRPHRKPHYREEAHKEEHKVEPHIHIVFEHEMNSYKGDLL